MNILEDFWYGNIEPSEYDISPEPEYKEMPGGRSSFTGQNYCADLRKNYKKL